ncbi:hypothetical protein ACOMHN_064680 [Nucella lapillus]
MPFVTPITSGPEVSSTTTSALLSDDDDNCNDKDYYDDDNNEHVDSDDDDYIDDDNDDDDDDDDDDDNDDDGGDDDDDDDDDDNDDDHDDDDDDDDDDDGGGGGGGGDDYDDDDDNDDDDDDKDDNDDDGDDEDDHEVVCVVSCHSNIGRQGGAQEVSLGTGCEGKGTIMHELNHALGFWHEQNRYDRDTYVTVHPDNIAWMYHNNFAKHYTSDMTTFDTPYDFGSVMHYGAYAFAVDTSKPSLSPKPGKATGLTMGQRLALSVQDVTRIQKLYQCTVGNIIDCNFDHDLCGLTHDTHDNFQWSRKNGSTPTSHTGPTADHTNSVGYYIYAEANGHHRQNARLMSSTVASGHYCLDFWLFQHGSQEGSFQILVAGSRIREQAMTTVSGNKDNAWKHYKINLIVPASFHVILQANIGDGDLGDIAIDDFAFYGGRCR